MKTRQERPSAFFIAEDRASKNLFFSYCPREAFKNFWQESREGRDGLRQRQSQLIDVFFFQLIPLDEGKPIPVEHKADIDKESAKDNTPGCTTEACSFRDSYEVFKDAGAEVIGVSSDSAASHEQFAKQHSLPFVLLSDENGAVRKRYGVPTTFGLLPGRVTYIIDKQGIVRNIFSSQFTPEKHISEALKTIQGL